MTHMKLGLVMTNHTLTPYPAIHFHVDLWANYSTFKPQLPHRLTEDVPNLSGSHVVRIKKLTDEKAIPKRAEIHFCYPIGYWILSLE